VGHFDWPFKKNKMHQTKNLYLGSFYYSRIMEVYSFRQSIYHTLTRFWTKDMGQTMVLMGNVLGASLVHVAPPCDCYLKIGRENQKD
jgi:hypothetical protein